MRAAGAGVERHRRGLRGRLALARARLVAELDGYAYHGHRRAFETDRERDLVLAAAGRRSVRVTDHQLSTTPSITAERFGALLRVTGAAATR